MKKVFVVICTFILTIDAWACTNFLVGKDASADGSTMISYAADSYSLYGFLHFSPAADYASGAMREIKDWDTGRPLGQIPQVSHTYSVVGNMNECQLTIGETTWGGREELWDTVGIDYGSLIYIALERCKTAREAIECMTDLVAQYGYASEGETFSIGDPNEVWIMDMIGRGKGQKGAMWVATRVPDNAICAHANQARTTKVPILKRKPRKKDKFVNAGDVWYCKDLITFARAKGYFSGKDEDFSYQAAFAPFDFSGLYVCEARVWSFFNHFSNDMAQFYDYATGKTFLETGGKDAGTPMPLYIVPNKKISYRDMQACMRDQYEGTPLDITKGTDAGPWGSKLRYGSLTFELDSVHYWYERPTATQQTGWSFVAQMRKDNPVGGIFWFGVDDAATNCYVPFYSCITSVPEEYAEGNGDLYTYSPTSAWWTFNAVANWAYSKYSRMLPEIQEQQKVIEDASEKLVQEADAEASKMNEADMRDYLTRFSTGQAQMTVAAWKELGIHLLVKYLDGQERKMVNGEFVRNAYGEPVGPNRPAFPENYLRTIINEIAHE